MAHSWHADGLSRRTARDGGARSARSAAHRLRTSRRHAPCTGGHQPMPVNVTLLELVNAITSYARNDDEIVATIEKAKVRIEPRRLVFSS